MNFYAFKTLYYRYILYITEMKSFEIFLAILETIFKQRKYLNSEVDYYPQADNFCRYIIIFLINKIRYLGHI